MSSALADRFRTWYRYERDCNGKALEMLRSVPAEAHGSPQFVRAVGKMAHLVAARHMWLFRLGVASDRPEGWFPATTLQALPETLAAVEERWTRYLDRLGDDEILADCTLLGEDGSRWRWRLEELLVQLFGHAWYHRGQIAMLVKDLGGRPVDTDYIFWTGPTPAGEEG